MNCLTACPSAGVKFSLFTKSIAPPLQNTGDQRRLLLKRSVSVAGGILALSRTSFSEGVNEGKIPVRKDFPVSPPGSLSLIHFTKHCTACHLCVSACPTGVLQPSLFHYGLGGVLQPHMDYHTQFCNFECTVCSEVCPTGAILPIQLEEKKLAQLGISKFIKGFSNG